MLARRVWPDGRTRAYVCGRSATVADLQELGGQLLSFYGQHEHRKLMLATAQLDAARRLLRPVAARAARARARRLRGGRGAAGPRDRAGAARGARERELDLVSLRAGRDRGRRPERRGGGGADRPARPAATPRDAAGRGGRRGAGDRARRRRRRRSSCCRAPPASSSRRPSIDPELAELCTRLQALSYDAQDIGSELRGYLDRIAETDGAARGSRGGGGAAGAVRAAGAQARRRDRRGARARPALPRACAPSCRTPTRRSSRSRRSCRRRSRDATSSRPQLSSARHKAAPKLAEAVCERLVELAMPDARFEIDLAPRARRLRAPRRRLDRDDDRRQRRRRARAAARGRLRGRALARHAGAAERRRRRRRRRRYEAQSELLVFDEIDAGIGGHTARAVGEHLRALAEGRQILCITHLPQVAALAQRHFTIVKQAGASPRPRP